jgi:hypothetical protein
MRIEGHGFVPYRISLKYYTKTSDRVLLKVILTSTLFEEHPRCLIHTRKACRGYPRRALTLLAGGNTTNNIDQTIDQELT